MYPDDNRPTSRRHLLMLGGEAVVGAAGATVAAAAPASAAPRDDLVLGVSNAAGAQATGLTASVSGAAIFGVENTNR